MRKRGGLGLLGLLVWKGNQPANGSPEPQRRESDPRSAKQMAV